MTNDQDPNSQTNIRGEEQSVNDDQVGSQRPVTKLDPSNIPLELHPLIPYAEKWGIRDEKLQRSLLHKASPTELEEVCQALIPAWDDVWKFVNSRPSSNEPLSYEVRIFGALLTTFDEAGKILQERMPQKWLEIIGWPEKFPGSKVAPAKLPLELYPLIPYAEKWVIEDDVVRDTAIGIASEAEIKDLISSVNQIGVETVRRLALKMTEDETREAEGYILLTLLELVEDAEFLLRTRGQSIQDSDTKSE